MELKVHTESITVSKVNARMKDTLFSFVLLWASRGPISRRISHREIYDRVKKVQRALKNHGDEATDRRLAGKSWSRESTRLGLENRLVISRDFTSSRRCLLWLSWIQEISSRKCLSGEGQLNDNAHFCATRCIVKKITVRREILYTLSSREEINCGGSTELGFRESESRL